MQQPRLFLLGLFWSPVITGNSLQVSMSGHFCNGCNIILNRKQLMTF
jgi:hypothetical protein